MISPETLLQNRYLVQKQIGKGGMGVVYMAIDQRFGSNVALKEIFLDAPHLRKAFEREARLLNHLRHPALPRVSDHFIDEDGQFIVMEFIPGADLWEMLKEKRVPFPLSSVLDWGDQLLDALEYLHGHEPPIVHRDIKPQNLKLTERGRIVLLDFGLAKGTPSHLTTATSPASVFGYSFNYAPLEQMQASGTDVRSDLYSLGATLYHLMTNVIPPDALTRATAVLNGEPDPLLPADEVQAQVTEPVARVLAAALAQNAAKRPQTATEMREALREASRQNSADALSPIVQPIASINPKKQTAQLIGPRATKPVTSYQLNDEMASSKMASSQNAATIVQPTPAEGRPQHSSASRSSPESFTTRIRTSKPPAPERRMSGRTIGILMSVVLLFVVAAAAYTFTRQPSTPIPSTQTVSSPYESQTPTVSAANEIQAPEVSPKVASAPASSQQSGTAPTNYSQSNPVDSPNSQPETPDSSATATQPKAGETTAGPSSNSSGLTPEAERARQADEIRRQRREREEEDIRNRRAEMDRERAREAEMQREREMRRGEPPPPRPGFPPPPRRDGRPPY
ncbi:MAG TPA: protein kinase [Pyrinomonadaceae bacterium]|jgi:serine/threonine protein kinase